MGMIAVPAAFAGPTVIDYVTPFTSSNGVSANGVYQVGQTITVPTGVSELDSFSLVFYDALGVALDGVVENWNGSAAGSTLFTGGPVASPGSTQVLGGYFAFTYNTAIAVTPGTQLFLGLVADGGGTFGGNVAWFGYPGNLYSGGNLLFNTGGGLSSVFGVGEDMAFSASFDTVTPDAPEPGSIGLMVAGALAMAFGRRRIR